MNILIPCSLDRASRRKDKSVALTFITNHELNSEEYMKIDEKIDKVGVLFFTESENISDQEVESISEMKKEVYSTKKTPSKRLRDVLYIWWNQSNQNMSWEDWYTSKMEVLIEHVKSKLE